MGAEIRIGDCVELLPAPGETLTRIARVEALWSDVIQGRERMLACCRMYKRPQVGKISSLSHAVTCLQEPLLLLSVPCRGFYGMQRRKERLQLAVVDMDFSTEWQLGL